MINNDNYIQKGLVLEGGGFRGIFTAGVLDFFLEKDLMFDNCIGVSAGSGIGASYVAKQYKRGFNAIADHINKREYASFYNLITTGDFFHSDYIYNRIVNELTPFDDDSFMKNPMKFQAVLTNIETGEAEYPQIKDGIKEVDYIRASSSLPFLAKIVKINNGLYLDGGIVDAIPIKKSIENGNKKNVVVLTREKGYRKENSSFISLLLTKLWYKKYPNLIKAMEIRTKKYNDTLDFIEKEEEKGSIFVIRPEKALTLGRIEKNREKLEETYKKGYIVAEKMYKELLEYLSS